MKNCNNCGTINIDTAIRCEACNMKGQFTFYSLPIKKEKVEAHIHCTNCGTAETGEGAKCMQCNFPIQRKDEEASQVIRTNLKAAQ